MGMGRTLHAIFNPTAGNGRARKAWPAVARRLRDEQFEVQLHQTTGPGHATELARELSRQGVDEIVIVGGDGTLNEVINGLLDGGRTTSSQIVLSVIPCGTGRDFSRNLGIRSVDQAIELLSDGAVCAMDVGLIEFQNGEESHGRCFVNVADVGLGAETAAYLNRSTKVLGGFLSYLIGAARTIIVFQSRPARVIVDGVEVHNGRTGMVVLANGRFLGGGMLMAPMASVHDGRFEILILDHVPKRTLLGSLLPRVYRGKHIGHPAVKHLSGERVEVSALDRLPFEVDGEQPGTTDLRARVLPSAIRVRVPRPARPSRDGSI